MKKSKITLLTLIIFLSSIFTAGCWNYREVDKLATVAGVAIDRGANGQYQVTAEILTISGGKDPKTTSKTVTMEGRTLFDAVRNEISLSGKRLYWSHAKVIILSKEIASEGVTKVIDWYNRDSETRADIHILISEGDSAKEIFSGQGTTEEIKSFVLDDMLKNQASLSKAPATDILRFDNDLKAKGISAIAPTVNLRQVDGKMLPHIIGTAIFKGDRLAGFLNGEETKDLIFIRNEIKGGVLVEEMQTNEGPVFITLEILKNKTKVIPVVDGQNVEIDLNIDTTVAIDEIEGTENFIDEEGRMEVEKSAENALKGRIESLIMKIQSEYGEDIFGFGAKLREDKVQVWNGIGDNWEEVFKDLQMNVNTMVSIKNSAILSKTLEVGD